MLSLVAVISCQLQLGERGTYEFVLQPNHLLFNKAKKKSGARIIQVWKQRKDVEAAWADAALSFRSESTGLKNLK